MRDVSSSTRVPWAWQWTVNMASLLRVVPVSAGGGGSASGASGTVDARGPGGSPRPRGAGAGPLVVQGGQHRFHGIHLVAHEIQLTGHCGYLDCGLSLIGMYATDDRGPIPSQFRRIGMKQSIEQALGVWSDGPGPLHRKLSDALRAAAEDGRLPAGERLPSERDLAQRLAVSRSTVVTAYDTLRSEGVLESRQGSGTRIRRGVATRPDPLETFQRQPGLPDADRRPRRRDLAGVRHLPRPSAGGGRHFARSWPTRATSCWPTTATCPAACRRCGTGLADMTDGPGTPTAPDQILVTTGAQQAVSLATHAAGPPGRRGGRRGAQLRRHPRRVPDPGRPDDRCGSTTTASMSARWRQAVQDGRPAAIYVMPTYHNPTGCLLAAQPAAGPGRAGGRARRPADRGQRAGELPARRRVDPAHRRLRPGRRPRSCRPGR